LTVREPSHVDASGAVRMVDVGAKSATARRATAVGTLIVGRDVMEAVRTGRAPKGPVYETARLAGIMAAKRTSEVIPLCHLLALDHAAVDFEEGEDRIVIRAQAATRAATGVEMEALTAVAVAGLTLIDMLKALSKTIVLTDIRLLAKSGGRSGDWQAGPEAG
jgi:cyclic pyranopterin phosphate synthase